MMTVPMDSATAAPSSARELVDSLLTRNNELEDQLRKSAQSKVPSDPNIWLQMRDNFEKIILTDHDFSEQKEVEYLLWQLHYKRIEDFRRNISAASLVASQCGKSNANPDRVKRIKSAFKSFLSEATGFYHDLMLKIKSNCGLPLGYFPEGLDNASTSVRDDKKTPQLKKCLISCHRCLIYLGDLARYKSLHGDGDSASREYAAASSYYKEAASIYPSSGNPHHQLAILASYSGNEVVAVYRYFRSLAADTPFTTARDNLIILFEKTSCCSLPGLKEMRPLKRKRIEAPRVAFLEDVHPHTKWSMCVRLYHKFHVDGFAPGRKRLYMILLDKGKMGAVMYDNDVDRLGPLLVEGRAYYISRMSARPLHRNMEYMFGDNREILCHLTNETAISEVKQVNEKFTPDFPEFMPFSRFWKNVFDDYKRVDVIAMPMRVSPVMYHRSACGRRIPTKNVQLMDDSYNMITLVVKDRLLTSNLFNWWKCAEDRKIIVVTMLQLKSDGPCVGCILILTLLQLKN